MVLQCTDILGTQDGGDYFWRNDDAFFRKANLESIFRSISHPEDTDKPSIHADYDSSPIVETAMDVLAMTQPQTVSLAPSPDQLRSAARKLLNESAFKKRYRIARKDLSRLLSLLLQLRQREAKWGLRFHFGTIEQGDPGEEGLADILMKGLGGDQDEEYLTSRQSVMAMELLVSLGLMARGVSNFMMGAPRFYCLDFACSITAFHRLVIAGSIGHDFAYTVVVSTSVFGTSNLSQANLQLRFHQLWAVLFQPPMNADDEAPSQIPGAVPSHVLAAISLFIPQPKISALSQPTKQDMRLSLKNISPPTQGSYGLTVTRLVQCLTQDAQPHLILLTSTATANTTLTIMGAYFPSPSFNIEGQKREITPKNPHLLFQLRPQFRILRWNGPHKSLTNIINTEDNAALSGAMAASDSPTSTKPFRIGDPERKGAALCVDLETKSATLASTIATTDIAERVGFQPVYLNGNDGEIADGSNWEVAVKIDQFELFRVNGGMDAKVASQERAKDQNRYAQDATTEEKIKGEELAKRIQGFGSASF